MRKEKLMGEKEKLMWRMLKDIIREMGKEYKEMIREE